MIERPEAQPAGRFTGSGPSHSVGHGKKRAELPGGKTEVTGLFDPNALVEVRHDKGVLVGRTYTSHIRSRKSVHLVPIIRGHAETSFIVPVRKLST
jgi:hypothetical protein